MMRTLLLFFLLTLSAHVFAQRNNVECEDTCTHIHGIDLSHYQGDVFWEQVGQSKMGYVYLKATEGAARIDAKYKRNIDLAHQYGLKVGSYHFYRPTVPQIVQLNNFRAQCRPEDQDLLPLVDVETRSGLSKEAFVDSLTVFLKLMEQEYKQKPLVYTGTNFYNAYLVGKLKGYKLMIAQYSQNEPELDDDADYIIWQYTAKGRLSGINGYVDKSRFMNNHQLREIRFRHR